MEITILEKNIMDKIAILIPCYNEEKTIEKVVKDWKKELPDAVMIRIRLNMENIWRNLCCIRM